MTERHYGTAARFLSPHRYYGKVKRPCTRTVHDTRKICLSAKSSERLFLSCMILYRVVRWVGLH